MMPGEKRYVFVSYSRHDVERVRPLVEAVKREIEKRGLPVELWMDVSHLHPGERWDASIADALQSSIGFLFFVSPHSMESGWVRREIEVAAAAPDRLIIPVLLAPPSQMSLPPVLETRQWTDLSGRSSREKNARAASEISESIALFLETTPEPSPAVSRAETHALAAGIAREVRGDVGRSSREVEPNSVFVVHGHDTEGLAMLEEYLASVGVETVVLSRRNESPQSLFQKFISLASKANFAVVLLTADDYGASRRQYEADGVGDRALKFRARQNVILELGFFYGLLGWESVFVMQQEPNRVFPDFELPSDLGGVVFASMADLSWKQKLSAKLAEAGFALSSVPKIQGQSRRRSLPNR
jgi:predicted nucleotide-binding protein